MIERVCVGRSVISTIDGRAQLSAWLSVSSAVPYAVAASLLPHARAAAAIHTCTCDA